MSARAVIELSGHIIDSMVLPRVMDSIMDMGATFHIEEFRGVRSPPRDTRSLTTPCSAPYSPIQV
jgi:hypothetical protein